MTTTTPALTFEARQRPGPSIAFPLVLIGLGGVFLLTNMGYITGLSWNRVAQLWPAILVLIGVDLLLRPRSMVAAVLAEVAIVGAALIFLVVAPPFGGATPGTYVAAENVAREGATEMSLTVGYGAGVLRFSGGASDLVAVKSTHQDVELQRVFRSGNTAAVSVRSNTPNPPFVTTSRSWDVRVPSDIPVALTLDLGAGDFNVDLRDVMITRATVNNGASNLEIALPRANGNVPVTISTGASSVDLRVPAGVEYRVRVTGGLNTISGPQESSGYSTAVNRLTIAISSGVPSITIH